MSFKKTAVCVTLALAGFASSAMADTSNGTVDFTGNIVNTPCAITTTNSALNVALGQVKSSIFTAIGITSESKPFNIVLSNCTVDTETPFTASVSFGGAGANTGKTSLAVNAGTDTSGKAVATGVGIQILDSAMAPLSLDVGSTAIDITSSEMIIPFNARYISTAAAVTPGLANGHSDFTVTYN